MRDFESAVTSDTKAFGVFFRAMLERGVYLPPSQFEAWFVSGAHTPAGYREDDRGRAEGHARGRERAAEARLTAWLH